MKSLMSYFSILALVTMISVGAYPANAGLLRFSPVPFLLNGVPTGGMPSWFQGQDGVAVQPCVDAARCALVGAPGFNPALAISFPANFPGEAFYFNATANFVMPGASDVLVVMALEYVFADALGNLVPAATPGAVATPFQRLRVRHTFIGGAGSTAAIGISANGTYTVTHPWGITKIPVSSFKCANSGGNTRCTFTRDVPLGGVVNFTAALGNTGFVAPDSGISTFLKDPTAPAGFLGTGAAALSYTGAFPAGNPNSVAITDPLGNTSGPISLLTTLTGQTVGIDLTLPVGGTNSGVVMPTGAVKRTFNINNRTGVAFTPIITANANAPNTTPVVASPDFTIVPSATLPCPTGAATLAIGANCNFDVNFTPIGADGPRTATISITDGPGAVPPAWAVVTGIADGTAPALALTGIAKFTNKASQAISGTATDANGIGAVTVTIDGAAPAAATVTGGTWSFTTGVLVAQDDATGLPVHNIVVNANDTALPAPGNAATSATSTIVVDATPPAVTLTVQGQGTTTKNATPVITFTAADRNLAVTTVKVDGTIITPTPASGAAMATLADGPHVVAVEATDAAGNVKLLAAPTITIDTIVSPFTLTPVTAVTRVKTQTIGGTVEAGSTVNVAIGTGAAAPATVTGTAWTFPANLVEGVNNITVTGADTLGNTGTLPAISIKVVLPDGKITGAASVGIADALKALQFAVGLTQPTAEEALHADVAPLVNGVPAPNDKVDIGDVVVILKKVVDPASW